MKNRSLHVLEILLLLIVGSESAVIPSKEDRSGDGEIPIGVNKLDDKLGLHPGGIWGPEEKRDDFGMYDFGVGGIDPNAYPDYDYKFPGGGNNFNEADKGKPGIRKPEKVPPRDEKPIRNDGDKEDDIDKKEGDEDAHEPFDGEEDIDKVAGGDKDKTPPPTDEDQPNHGEGDKAHGDEDEKKEPKDKEGPLEDDERDKIPDEDEKKSSEDEDEKIPEENEDEKIPEENEDEKIPEEGGDEKGPEENESDKEFPNEDVDKKEHVPIDGDESDSDYVPPKEGDEKHDDEEEKNIGDEFVHEPSIFDTPIFNLEQVKKYFSQLERALGHVFRQTVDEAALLNGTYANTTDEEIEIDGKKYTVRKSIIHGVDNDSSIYVEALSSVPETNDTQELKGNDLKNDTHV